MKANLFASLCFAVLLAGCVTSSKPGGYSYRDEYRGESIDMTSPNLLPSAKPSDGQLWFDASRITERGGIVLYYFQVHYKSPTDWIIIEPGESLHLTIDGTELRFDGRGSQGLRTMDANSQMTEAAIYLTTASDIRKIGDAKDVKVKIIGQARTVERSFSPDNFAIFKKFVSAYLDTAK